MCCVHIFMSCSTGHWRPYDFAHESSLGVHVQSTAENNSKVTPAVSFPYLNPFTFQSYSLMCSVDSRVDQAHRSFKRANQTGAECQQLGQSVAAYTPMLVPVAVVPVKKATIGPATRDVNEDAECTRCNFLAVHGSE